MVKDSGRSGRERKGTPFLGPKNGIKRSWAQYAQFPGGNARPTAFAVHTEKSWSRAADVLNPDTYTQDISPQSTVWEVRCPPAV